MENITVNTSSSLAQRFKPGAPVWVHLMLAASWWTLLGSWLLYRAASAIVKLDPAVGAAVGAGAVAIGLFKGMKILRPAARRGAKRIIARGDGKCIGGFISWKMWLIILSMMVVGRGHQSAGMSPWITGLILGGVSMALIFGATTYWQLFFAKLRE